MARHGRTPNCSPANYPVEAVLAGLSWRVRLHLNTQAFWRFCRTVWVLRSAAAAVCWCLATRCIVWSWDLQPGLLRRLDLAALLWLLPWLDYMRRQQLSAILCKRGGPEDSL